MCQTCDKGFTQKTSLQRHDLVYTGQRSFTRKTCDKEFTRVFNARKHQLLHTGKRPFML